jgi:adenylate cyclase class 2
VLNFVLACWFIRPPVRRRAHPPILCQAATTAAVGTVSLCVDDLEGVGTFLELERLAHGDVPPEDVQAELAAFVTGLGVRAQRTEETYDSLVRGAQVASA